MNFFQMMSSSINAVVTLIMDGDPNKDNERPSLTPSSSVDFEEEPSPATSLHSDESSSEDKENVDSRLSEISKGSLNPLKIEDTPRNMY